MIERELELLPIICRKDKCSVDIGAAKGQYASVMARYSRFVYAFEPLINEYAIDIQNLMQNNNNVVILNYAISDKCGRGVLSIPLDGDDFFTFRGPGYASLSQEFSGSPCKKIDVHIKTLDSFQLDNVGLIKIDVEGNEINVINGSLDTIENNRPVLMIEMEQRHIDGDVEDNIKYIKSLNYSAYFYDGNKLKDISMISLRNIQESSLRRHDLSSYVNNIIFIPEDKKSIHPLSCKNNIKNVGFVTTYGIKCGIARYSHYLGKALSELDNIQVRMIKTEEEGVPENGALLSFSAWSRLMEMDVISICRKATDLNMQFVIVQYHHSFFINLFFDALIKELNRRGIGVAVIFHSTTGAVLHMKSLDICHKILVHTQAAYNEATQAGRKNVELFEHGVFHRSSSSSEIAKQSSGLEGNVVISSFGFLNDTKGFIELIRAFKIIIENMPNMKLLLLASCLPDYKDTGKAILEQEAAENGLSGHVIIITDFLEEDELFKKLECSDVIVFPYQRSVDNTSGAAKIGLAAGRPVLVSDAPVFDDLKGVVKTLPGSDPAGIAQGILDFFKQPEEQAMQMERQQAWVKRNCWESKAQRLAEIMNV